MQHQELVQEGPALSASPNCPDSPPHLGFAAQVILSCVYSAFLPFAVCWCCPLENASSSPLGQHVALTLALQGPARRQGLRSLCSPPRLAWRLCLLHSGHLPSSPPLTPPAGPAAPPEPPFPDIYGGDAQLWEAHFRGIGRAYRALGKEDDFAIRLLTEDFTLPFPFAWPPGPDPARGPLFYDPHDRAGFDFLLRGPGAPPPALLRPLHSTAQAAERKRRLERLARSYAHAGAGQPPGLVLLPPGPEAGTPAAAPPGWASPRRPRESQ